MVGEIVFWVAAGVLVTSYVLGALSAVDAVLKTRTPQGATAWALALLLTPFLALPVYWVFGRTKFDDYTERLRAFDRAVNQRIASFREDVLGAWIVEPDEADDERTRGELRGFCDLATVPFVRGNEVRLLVDGEATFEAIFAAIEAAEAYVLAQFYIIRDDAIGRAFRDRLLAAAARGVKVYLLYDEVGCYGLPNAYLAALREGGVEVSSFSGFRSWLGRFRLNFRNHRKIVVTDGQRAFAGGLNVGDEYLGRDPAYGPWRDTHVAVEGPAVLGLQYSFVRDWYYGRQETPDVTWHFEPAEANRRALVLASGPADPLETCGLLYTHAIESAERRVWLATPYFVPDGRVLGALQLAALRGVDVRVLMPRTSDSFLFKYVPFAYLPEVARAGGHAYLYEEGFMHQKVLLVDDDYAAVGTANFDNRSFRFNFEVTLLVHDAEFCGDVERMLQADFARATRLDPDALNDRSFAFRLAMQLTRLLAPVL